MVRIPFGLLMLGLVFTLALGRVLASDGDYSAQPEGMFSVSPVLERSCMAVKISLSETQALAGIKWFNNDDQTPFPKILVAGGLSDLPPNYGDGVIVGEEIIGQRYGWSELEFPEPIGSLSEALYVVFQLPEYFGDSAQFEGPGIGYEQKDEPSCVFLSADGNEWARLKTEYGLMVEPIIVAKTPEMMGLKMLSPGEEEKPDQDLPKASGLKAPFPNPCNPVTTIEFSLAKPQKASLKVFDVRGRLVRTLAHGEHKAGRYMVEWRGRDNRGAGVASGVYFVKMETNSGQWSHRVVLLK